MVLHWFKCVQSKLNALPTQQCTNGNASEALLSPHATLHADAQVHSTYRASKYWHHEHGSRRLRAQNDRSRRHPDRSCG